MKNDAIRLKFSYIKIILNFLTNLAFLLSEPVLQFTIARVYHKLKDHLFNLADPQ